MATTHEIQLGSCHAHRKQQRSRRRRNFVLWVVCSLATLVATAAQAVHLPAPTVQKAFSPSQVSVGGTTQMTITLTNDNAVALTGVAFTDSYPAGMQNASSGVIVTNTCGGAPFTADPNGQSATLVGGTIPANGYCVIVLNVSATAAAAGTTLTNHTGSVTSINAFGSADATADLTVTTQALMQAPTVTMTPLPASITVGGFGSVLISLTNLNVFDLNGVQFAINYPSPTHIVNAAGGAILDEDGCAPFSLAPDGGTSLIVTNATIPAGGSCVFILTVTGTTAGDSDLHTGPVLSANASPGADASATLSVTNGSLLPAPRLDKTFSPNSIKIGGTSQLTFTFTNEDPSNAVTGLQQVDLYPYNIANAPNALVSNTCGGLVLLHAHDGNADDFHLFNGTIPPGGTCSVVVNVVGTTAATGHNAIINDRNGNAQTGSTASADEAVTAGSLLGAPTATKQFSPTSVAVGAPSQMTITLTNANSFAITGAQFTDNYPDGMVNAPNNPIASNDCGGIGTVTADPDGHSATLVNGTIPAVPLGSCKVVINVVGAFAGSWVNQTGEIPAANALTGASTFGALTVTATPQTIAFTSPAPVNATVSGPTYDATAQATSNLPVTLTIDAASASVCSISAGTVSFIGVGTCTIDANQAGDAIFAPAPQVQQSFTVAPPSGVTPQTITFTSAAPANAKVAGPTYSATAHATSNLPVTLTIDTTSDTVCTINSGTVSFIGVGTCTIDANQGGDSTYAPAPQVQQSFAVAASNGVAPQIITFTSTAPVNASVGGPSYSATAHATSNLPVTLTIDAGSGTVCAISNGTVSFIGIGTCTIDANQGGDAIFAPAPQVQQSFSVTGAAGATPQTIAFTSTPPANAKVGDPAYVAIASATSNLQVSLTIDSASDTVCTINNSTVSFIGVGTCTIDANQGGDATFAPAPQVQQSFAVAASSGVTPQTIVFTSVAPVNAAVGGPSYVATAHASSSLPVTLSIDATSDTVCTINNGTVSFIAAGTCTIDANQGGDATFAPAPQVQQSFAVVFAGGITPQTIAFTSPAPANAKVAGSTYAAIAHATSNLPVDLTIDATSDTVCAINGSTVTFIGVGTCTIDANQGGDATFAPAPQLQQSFSVGSAGGVMPQTITFTSQAPANAKVAGASYSATAHATSNLPVVLTIDNASNTVCAINNGTVTFIGIGICTIDANQGGDATFAAASQVQQSFTVGSTGGVTPQTIAFTSVAPANAKAGGAPYVATAHATSNLPVILTIDAVSITACTINNGTVTFIGAGTCTIDANQGGNAIFAPATQVQQPIAVASGGGVTPQTIAFTSTAPVNASIGGATYVATAHATSNLPVVLTIDSVSNAVCTINNGTVTFIGSGTCTIDANQGGNATFAPAPQKQQSFAVAAGTGGGVPIAIGDEIEVAPGATATTLVGNPNSPSSVLYNDANVAVAELVNAPAHASTFTFNPDGTFVYQNNGVTTPDSFTYRARNAQSVYSNVATVTITVGVGLNNHPPFAVGDAIEVVSGGLATGLVGDSKALASVLDNDSDPDASDTLTATKLSDPTHGAITFDATGAFSYQNDGVDPAATSDSFVYQVCDNHGACDMGVVTITIGNGLNDHLPIVVDDAIQTTPGGQSTTLIGDLNNPSSVLDNDSDPDAGDTLTAVKASSLLNASGTLTFGSDGKFTYQNTDPMATTDSFLYDACDQHGACKAGIVTITITNNPPDQPPIAMDDAILVGPNGTAHDLLGDANVVDSLLDNDTDVGDTLRAFVISDPANGNVTANLDGTFTYTNTSPVADSFEYEVCDSYGACTPATVSVTIDPSAPTVTCMLPPQLNMVGDAISIDLSLLFAPPPGKTLSYSVINPPPPLSILGSLLTGTLDASGIYMSTLEATTVPGGVSTTEDVTFQVLPAGDILLRNGFEDSAAGQPCQ